MTKPQGLDDIDQDLLDDAYSVARTFCARYRVPLHKQDDYMDAVPLIVVKRLRAKPSSFRGTTRKYIAISVWHDSLKRLQGSLTYERRGYTATHLPIEDWDTTLSFSSEVELIGRIDLKRAFDRLPERPRNILVMNRVGGMEMRDVAKKLGISLVTASRDSSFAARRLEVYLRRTGLMENAHG